MMQSGQSDNDTLRSSLDNGDEDEDGHGDGQCKIEYVFDNR